jgi:site-specific recombinase XerD
VVEKKMQKTKSMLYLPLNKKAASLLPPRKDGNEFVFDLPNSMTTTESYIKVWSEFAMIDKHVTFHTSRHTFAVNILACGGDVFTLSKLLGHKKVTTTQIYADVRDEAKTKTMELLDKFD